MADAARKAGEELQKAAQAKKEGKDEKSSEHLEKALRALAGNNSEKKESADKNKEANSPQNQSQQQSQQQNSRPGNQPQQRPGSETRKGAEQMLELMGEDDKKLRSAIKKNMRMRRTQTEKDW
jgi:hypothetical protein